MSAQSAIFNPSQTTSAASGDGFSVPRLTTTGRLAISFTTADKGMMVYDVTLNNLFIWNGSAWESVPASGDAGPNGAIQYNDNGVVVGDANNVWDKTAQKQTIAGNLSIWRGAGNNSGSVAVGSGLSAATGINNTVVGAGAGNAITTGQSNTAVGFQAGNKITTGQTNVAFGPNAMGGDQNITGNYNVAIGDGALYADGGAPLSTDGNVCIGPNAGRRTTTGATNIFIGSQAGFAAVATTGNDNIGIGRSAMRNLSSGSFNVGVGNDAGSSITTALQCTAVGSGALTQNQIGANCTAIGAGSLVNTTGGANTALGTSAGSNITTGTNNICIGVSANASAVATNNELVIGSAGSFVATDGLATTYFPFGAAGGVALPATCSGAIRIYLNGTFVKIPVYPN